MRFLDKDHGKYIDIFDVGDGIAVQPEGTGVASGGDPPVFIEWWDGKPRIIIWADINEEDPTHIIDLSGALESALINPEE